MTPRFLSVMPRVMNRRDLQILGQTGRARGSPLGIDLVLDMTRWIWLLDGPERELHRFGGGVLEDQDRIGR